AMEESLRRPMVWRIALTLKQRGKPVEKADCRLPVTGRIWRIWDAAEELPSARPGDGCSSELSRTAG
ncbi:MAG TPA: hypothetical protein PK472_17780, partial [Pseudomonadota bacterium]|nr:hypothetical protein [Pseudomonadota bacterium]